MSKGSKQRPTDKNKFDSNYDRIFGEKAGAVHYFTKTEPKWVKELKFSVEKEEKPFKKLRVLEFGILCMMTDKEYAKFRKNTPIRLVMCFLFSLVLSVGTCMWILDNW